MSARDEHVAGALAASDASIPTACSAYELTLVSSVDLAYPLVKAERSSGRVLRFGMAPNPPVSVAFGADEATYHDGAPLAEGEISGRLVQLPGWDVLRFSGSAGFFVSDKRVICHLRDRSFRFAIEIWLLGTVLVHWLERHGTPTLHESPVELDRRCFGFLASNKGAKTSLALSFVRAGHRLVGDDVLRLRVAP